MYTCLGDLFSVTWMSYLEANENKLRDLTLKQLYHDIKQIVSVKSEVETFGGKNITNQAIDTVFLQDPSTMKQSWYHKFTNYLRSGKRTPVVTSTQSENMFYYNHDLNTEYF